jgi:hypothetical protein
MAEFDLVNLFNVDDQCGQFQGELCFISEGGNGINRLALATLN